MTLSILAVACVSVACAEREATTPKPVFQRLEVGNDGVGVVQNVVIAYGALTVPAGTMHRTFSPSHMPVVSESWTISVPERVAISWTSADGQSHDVVAPMRSFIQDAACFHGFQFFFVDDHVDIYLVSRKYDCSKLLDVEKTKVFSSANSR
ncbi:MAG TPA: hypothetical protein VFA75_03500 [Nevskia sp.]|nr:hypothetical protein [Nevskia sp.]